MKTLNDLSSVCSEAINPLDTEIRIPVQEGFHPQLIDLARVFGARGLRFKVAVESHGQVEAYLFRAASFFV